MGRREREKTILRKKGRRSRLQGPSRRSQSHTFELLLNASLELAADRPAAFLFSGTGPQG